MSIRNLDAIFRPKSVALIGASNRPNSVGGVIANNLRAGGFEGPILPVNPKHQAVAGILAYPDVASLPLTPDLAVICTPAGTVPQLIAELGARGTKGAIVISAGFGESTGAAGRSLQQAMLDAAKPHLMRVVGPNCVGVLSTPSKLNASFAQTTPCSGKVAFVSQSGAMLTTVLDWAASRGIGFSHLVSLGDMADVDFGDMLDYLASDEQTSAILLYIEAVTHARKFMSAARAASRLKPVIAIKAGRHAAAAKAASSHTGALAGIDSVYDAAFRRAGILRAYDVDEVFDAVETLSYRPPASGDRLTILTNGGGIGVLATDALAAQGGKLASLSDMVMEQLNTVLPATWSHGNPVDIIGDADAQRYEKTLQILNASADQDAILVLNCPTAVGDSVGAARSVAAIAKTAKVPVLASWLGARSAAEVRSVFASANVPAYDTPEKATRAFMHMVRYHRSQELLLEAPPAASCAPQVDKARARAILSGARGWLPGSAAQDLLSCYGVPFVRTAQAKSPEDAARLAADIGGPVALKIVSPDITHKSEAGGVALSLSGAGAVLGAARQMMSHIAATQPKARLDGLLVQEMAQRPRAYELIVGMAVDRTFGPFLLFGQGGTAVEVIDDKAVGLPPLNLKLAREMMSRTRIERQLRGYRDRPAVDLDAVAQTLVALSQLVCDFPEIAEIDINPLLADERGVLAVDARIRIGTEPPVPDRLAIRPYPAELSRQEDVPGVGTFQLRPIRPEDAAAVERLIGRLTPDDIHRRFFSSLKMLSPSVLARLTQIDYDREMALVLFDKDNEIAAIGRIAADPDNTQAEFALLVRSDLQRHGLGTLVMHRLYEYARARGIKELWGDILSENGSMVALCRTMGCKIARSPRDATVMRATRRLDPVS